MKENMYEEHMHEDHIHKEHEKIHGGTSNKNKMLVMRLREINHIMRSLSEGKGSQKRILIMLLEEEMMTQRVLTERLGIQPGSASEVIAKLEKSGLITRTESIKDRRTTDIMLTEQGKTLAVEAAKARRARHEEMFSSLSEEEKDALLMLLEKVDADWQERYKNVEDRHHNGHGHEGRRR